MQLFAGDRLAVAPRETSLRSAKRAALWSPGRLQGVLPLAAVLLLSSLRNGRVSHNEELCYVREESRKFA